MPGTEISLLRFDAPDGSPQYRFSAETVRRLPQYYAAVRDMPTHDPSGIDFYQNFSAAPGLALPIRLYRAVLNLPEFFRALYYKQAVWQWIALVVLTALTVLLLVALMRWESMRATSIDRRIRTKRYLVQPLWGRVDRALLRWGL